MIALRPGPGVIAGGGNFVIGRERDFFLRQKRRGLCYARKLLIAMTFARRNAFLALDNRVFGAGHGNGPQQELGEVAEGGGFLAGNAALREQAKHLGEGAVHAGGGGEVAAGGMEFGKVECGADDVTSG